MQKKPLRTLALGLNAIALLALSACGGGSANNDPDERVEIPQDPIVVVDPGPYKAPANVNTSTGIFSGDTTNGRKVMALLQDDGSYFVFYSKVGIPSVIAGVVVGNQVSQEGNITSIDGREFSSETGTHANVMVNAQYRPRADLNGTIVNNVTAETLKFSTAYNTIYDSKITVAALEGTYIVAASKGLGNEASIFKVDAEGMVSGDTASGCTFTGRVLPKKEGAVFDVALTFGPAPCLAEDQLVTGVGYLNTNDGSVMGAAINADRTHAFAMVGEKVDFVLPEQPKPVVPPKVEYEPLKKCDGPGFRLVNDVCASWANVWTGKR